MLDGLLGKGEMGGEREGEGEREYIDMKERVG